MQFVSAHRTVSCMWPHKQFDVCSLCRHTVPHPACGTTNSLLSAVCVGTPYRIMHVAPWKVSCLQFVSAHRTVSCMWPHKQFDVCNLCRHTVPYPACGPTKSFLFAVCVGTRYHILHVAPQISRGGWSGDVVGRDLWTTTTNPAIRILEIKVLCYWSADKRWYTIMFKRNSWRSL